MQRLIIIAILSLFAAISIVLPPTPSAGKFTDGTISSVEADFDDTKLSNRHNRVGHEFMIQKKIVRRSGCSSAGCILKGDIL